MTPLYSVVFGVGCLLLAHWGALFTQSEKTLNFKLRQLSLILVIPLALGSLTSLLASLTSSTASNEVYLLELNIAHWLIPKVTFTVKSTHLKVNWAEVILSLALMTQAYRRLTAERKWSWSTPLCVFFWFYLSDSLVSLNDWTLSFLQVTALLSVSLFILSALAPLQSSIKPETRALSMGIELSSLLSMLSGLCALFWLFTEMHGPFTRSSQQIGVFAVGFTLVLAGYWRLSELTRGVVGVSLLYLLFELA